MNNPTIKKEDEVIGKHEFSNLKIMSIANFDVFFLRFQRV